MDDLPENETELIEEQLTLSVAATMCVVLGCRYDADDAAMNEACARAVQIALNARAGDDRAQAVVLDAMERLSRVVRTIPTRSAALTAAPH